MKRQPLILSLICILFIAPLCAWLIAHNNHPNTKPEEKVVAATKEDILHAIQTHNTSSSEEDTYDFPSSVVSVKQMDTWWYIAIVKIDGGEVGSYEAPVLLSKFTNGDDSIRIITKPGADLTYHNISGGMGVPYDVIDELHKSLGDEHDE